MSQSENVFFVADKLSVSTMRSLLLASLGTVAAGFLRLPAAPALRSRRPHTILAAVGGFGGSATRVDPAVAMQALNFFIDDKVLARCRHAVSWG